MSIRDQIDRINAEKKRIATKTTQFGLTDNDTANLKTLADAIDGIEYHECVDVNIKEGGSFEIVPGYHRGGMVYAVNNPELDAAEYVLETGRVVTPVKNADLTIVKGEGYYGLGAVVVKKIPDPYHDVSQVDAQVAEVLSKKKFVDANGVLQTGTMPEIGTIDKTLDATSGAQIGSSERYLNREFHIPKGYHNGDGVVKINFDDTKEITPKEYPQYVEADSGSNTVLGMVKVNAIPSNYKNLSGQTILPFYVLKGYYYVAGDGSLTEGTIPVNSNKEITLSLSHPSETLHQQYYSDSLIKISPEKEREVTPSKETQLHTPAQDKVLSSVKVLPIPDEYQDLTNQTVTAADVLNTAKFVAKNGTLTDGTIPNLGLIERYVDIYNETGWTLGESGCVRDVSIVFQDQTLIAELQKI